jgi:hypothetical protein
MLLLISVLQFLIFLMKFRFNFIQLSLYKYLVKSYNFALYVLFRIGDYVTLGGRVAVRDHVSIVSKVLIW